jgi:hypothetical protein
MAIAQKLQLRKAVWDNLCREAGDMRLPEWHQAALEERTRRLETGQATVSSWADAKARLLKPGQ